MKNERIVFETDDKKFKIIEVLDEDVDLENLKGDMFNLNHSAEMQPGKSHDEIKREEREFEDMVNREGVYGYVLLMWDPTPGAGYQHIDSCFGFIGQYSPGDKSGIFDHYIVEELKSQIKVWAKK